MFGSGSLSPRGCRTRPWVLSSRPHQQDGFQQTQASWLTALSGWWPEDQGQGDTEEAKGVFKSKRDLLSHFILISLEDTNGEALCGKFQ